MQVRTHLVNVSIFSRVNDQRNAVLVEKAYAVIRANQPEAPRFASVPFWVMGEDDREAPGRRQCTREYKIDVVKRDVREVLGLKKGQRAQGKYVVEGWVGISLDEASRAKPSRYPWIVNRWPLLYDIPMRRNQCIDSMESR